MLHIGKFHIYKTTEDFLRKTLINVLKSGGGNKQAFDFGKNRARMARGKTVTFDDVAGCDEEKEELVEIIDFSRHISELFGIQSKFREFNSEFRVNSMNFTDKWSFVVWRIFEGKYIEISRETEKIIIS